MLWKGKGVKSQKGLSKKESRTQRVCQRSIMVVMEGEEGGMSEYERLLRIQDGGWREDRELEGTDVTEGRGEEEGEVMVEEKELALRDDERSVMCDEERSTMDYEQKLRMMDRGWRDEEEEEIEEDEEDNHHLDTDQQESGMSEYEQFLRTQDGGWREEPGEEGLEDSAVDEERKESGSDEVHDEKDEQSEDIVTRAFRWDCDDFLQRVFLKLDPHSLKTCRTVGGGVKWMNIAFNVLMGNFEHIQSLSYNCFGYQDVEQSELAPPGVQSVERVHRAAGVGEQGGQGSPRQEARPPGDHLPPVPGRITL